MLPQPQVVTRNAKVQTAEPVVGRAEFDTLQTQLSDVGAQLREKEREIVVSPSTINSTIDSMSL